MTWHFRGYAEKDTRIPRIWKYTRKKQREFNCPGCPWVGKNELDFKKHYREKHLSLQEARRIHKNIIYIRGLRG